MSIAKSSKMSETEQIAHQTGERESSPGERLERVSDAGFL